MSSQPETKPFKKELRKLFNKGFNFNPQDIEDIHHLQLRQMIRTLNIDYKSDNMN